MERVGDILDRSLRDLDKTLEGLETKPFQNMTLGLTYRDDDSFDSLTYLEARYSFGRSDEKSPLTLNQRMTNLPRHFLD